MNGLKDDGQTGKTEARDRQEFRKENRLESEKKGRKVRCTMGCGFDVGGCPECNHGPPWALGYPRRDPEQFARDMDRHRTHTHARKHARTHAHAHTHARTHTHAHTYTRARARTYTQTYARAYAHNVHACVRTFRT